MAGISYIITTFNRPTLLKKSVNSIIAERTIVECSFPSELIIVDDCSHTPVQLADTVTKHFGSDLRLIRNDRNLGVIGARNVGIHAAKYDSLLFLDDDDQSWPNRSQVLLPYIVDLEQSYAFVSGKSELRYPNHTQIIPYTQQRELDPLTLLANPPHIDGIIWRKDKLMALGGMDDRVPYLGEHITLHQLLLQGERGLQIEEVVSSFAYIPDGLTTQAVQGNVLRQRIIEFLEVLAIVSRETQYHSPFVQIRDRVAQHPCRTFDEYLTLVHDYLGIPA